MITEATQKAGFIAQLFQEFDTTERNDFISKCLKKGISANRLNSFKKNEAVMNVNELKIFADILGMDQAEILAKV